MNDNKGKIYHGIYPTEPWSVTETAFIRENNYRNETTFALSNGYIGTRGTLEEGYDFSIEEGLEGNFVKISFRLQIDDLVDSTIMQLYPIEFAKGLFESFVLNQPTPEPAPAPEPSAPPVM